MTVDEHLFDGWEKRLDAAYNKPRLWCKCGHIEGTHFAQTHMVIDDGLGGFDTPRSYPLQDEFHCHFKGCDCTEFRKKPRRNWFRKIWNGQG